MLSPGMGATAGVRLLSLGLLVVLFAAACGGSDGSDSTADAVTGSGAEPAAAGPEEPPSSAPAEPEPPVAPEPPPEPAPVVVTREEFVEAADAICLEVDAQLDALPEPETMQELAALTGEAKGAAEVGLARLGDLDIPPGDEAAVAAVFGPLGEQVDLFDDLGRAAAAEDEMAINEIVSLGEELDAATHEAAVAYGFGECGIDDDLTEGDSASGTAGEPDTGDVTIQYIPPESPELEAAFTFLQESGVLDEIVQGVNDTLALREDVLVSVEEFPDNPGPAYYPSERVIVMPPEFVELVADILIQSELVETQEDLEAQAAAITAFVFLHEIGHALVDQLEIPITGREEDAVDQLATVVVTDAEEGAGAIAVSAASLFGAFAANREAFDEADFWNEHSLDEQRFFNLLCWVYGADPSVYGEIAELGIGEARLAGCQEEFAQIKSSWETLLGPFLKTG
jgi:hypothetical protein